jgi:hypothetical protein
MGLLVNTMKTKTNRTLSVREEIEPLPQAGLATQGQIPDVFGESSRSNHKQFLFRRIAWRLQANAWGGLSERAVERWRSLTTRTFGSLRCIPQI